jgi:hypothetical protein
MQLFEFQRKDMKFYVVINVCHFYREREICVIFTGNGKYDRGFYTLMDRCPSL